MPNRLCGPVVLLSCLASALWGCGSVVHQVDEQPKPALSSEAALSSRGGEGAVDFQWWRAWPSSELRQLCQRLQRQNLDLRRAAQRVRRAEALVRLQGAGARPSVALAGQVGASQQNFFFGGGSQGKSLTVNQVTFPLNLQFNWEVDLWGRVQHATAAASREVMALRRDREAFTISLTGQLADAWLRRQEARARLALLERQTKLNQDLLKLLKLRFGQGMATSVDVLQQRSQLEAIVGQRPLLEQAAQLASNQIRQLLGVAPGQAFTEGAEVTLPRVPPLPAAGLPAELVSGRPDVIAAQQRLIAADHRFGSAKAALLPAIRLGATAGFQGRADPFGFLDNFVGNLLAGLTAPLWQGGRLRAQKDAEQAATRDAALAYAQVALRAVWEADNALLQERKQRQRVTALREQVKLAQTTLEQARQRFAAGQGSYLVVLQVLANAQRLEAELLGAQRARLSSLVAVYRSLAGQPKSPQSKAAAERPQRRLGANQSSGGRP